MIFQKVPPLTLTKSELASLYQSAVAKGETLKLGTGDDSYIHAAVHELEDGSPNSSHNGETPSSTSEDSGYYYYYYPIKSFIDELTSQVGTVIIFVFYIFYVWFFELVTDMTQKSVKYKRIIMYIMYLLLKVVSRLSNRTKSDD